MALITLIIIVFLGVSYLIREPKKEMSILLENDDSIKPKERKFSYNIPDDPNNILISPVFWLNNLSKIEPENKLWQDTLLYMTNLEPFKSSERAMIYQVLTTKLDFHLFSLSAMLLRIYKNRAFGYVFNADDIFRSPSVDEVGLVQNAMTEWHKKEFKNNLECYGLDSNNIYDLCASFCSTMISSKNKVQDKTCTDTEKSDDFIFSEFSKYFINLNTLLNNLDESNFIKYSSHLISLYADDSSRLFELIKNCEESKSSAALWLLSKLHKQKIQSEQIKYLFESFENISEDKEFIVILYLNFFNNALIISNNNIPVIFKLLMKHDSFLIKLFMSELIKKHYYNSESADQILETFKLFRSKVDFTTIKSAKEIMHKLQGLNASEYNAFTDESIIKKSKKVG